MKLLGVSCGVRGYTPKNWGLSSKGCATPSDEGVAMVRAAFYRDPIAASRRRPATRLRRAGEGVVSAVKKNNKEHG